MTLLRLSHIAKQYAAETVLTDATLHVNTVEKVGLIGANGSGKTTLLRIAIGLEAPSEGTRELSGDAALAMVPQRLEFGDQDTVLAVAKGRLETAELELRAEEQ
jgi:ATPase subunit of ABC transporter with duplicated ATPase domains